MRCWLAIISMAIINYALGIPVNEPTFKSEVQIGNNTTLIGGNMSVITVMKGYDAVHGYRLSEDYTSDGGKDPKTLAGVTNTEKSKRSLIAGDTFTPQEMLPIAEKLLNQVEEPGSGQGFVSSTKGSQELADKLFEAFFVSTKRIVTLKDQDIIGIDALQALALQGEVADNSLQEEEEEVTEPAQKMYLRGQLIDVKKSKPLKSHYKLVTKIIPQKIKRKLTKLTKEKRRGIPLAKKLPPKRHLVVNQRSHLRNGTQKKNNEYKKVTQRVGIINKHMKNRFPSVEKKKKEGDNKRKKSNCHWKYVCSTPGDLDTCRVHTTCGKASSLVTSAQKHKDKTDKLLDQFRRMVGITTVDEEVEKILEVRNMKLRPVNLEAIERVESLAEFFNNIIVRENMESTTSLPKEHFLKVSDEPLTPQPEEDERH